MAARTEAAQLGAREQFSGRVSQHHFYKFMNYIAKVTSVYPAEGWSPRCVFPRCYAGVSIGHPNFRGARLSALLRWIASHFDRCTIVVGDDLYRLSVMIRTGMDETSALRFARKESRFQYQELVNGVGNFPSHKFTIRRWCEFTSHRSFSPYQVALAALLRSNRQFHNSVMISADDYLKRRPDRSLAVSRRNALSLSSQYLLEEMAVFCILVRDGWLVDVYPGPELPVLAEMSRGLHEAAPPPLRRRIGISLEICKPTTR